MLKRATINALLLILLAYASACGCDDGYTNTRFNLSVENKTSVLLREVAFKMTPEGEFEFGILSPGAEANYMNPPLKEINAIHLTFKEDAGALFDFDLKTAVPNGFRGEIRVLIVEIQGKKSASVVLVPK